MVLCVCLSLVSPSLGRRQSTRKPRPTTMSRRRTTATSRPTTITTPPVPRDACEVDGKIYDEGATISRDSENCYGSVCMGGSVTFWDNRCFLNGQPDCDGQLVDIPGQCCHECVTTTSPPTTSPTTIPDILTGACLVNGLSYMDGEIIHRDPGFTSFGAAVATSSMETIGVSCRTAMAIGLISRVSVVPNVASTPRQQRLQPHLHRVYLLERAKISGDAEHCAESFCMEGYEMYRDDKCMLGGQPDCPNGHLVDIPGQCCHECIEDITTVPPSVIVG
ncbi:hypothetical protein DPMN_026292 [Dreissena polymorpha]|uniref:Uncharacterized protein n=1 Tax=Dreissena polymorpha TaxID=45954 RepID=A0A9D4REE7_DREPO|nr:hypothetical protein DPMN_026292 [Dreissena polymorpha]